MLRLGRALLAGAAAVVVDLLRQQADQTSGGSVVGGQREIEGQYAVPEDALAHGHGLVEVGALLVDLGDDHCARHADRRALLPQQTRAAVDTVHRGDDEQCGVRGAEPGAEVTDEVGVPGGVQQVDLDAVVLERRQRQRDRALLAHLRLVEVAHRGAVLDATGPRDRPGRDEQGLDERRLPRSGVADQHDVADVLRAVGPRCPAGGCRGGLRWSLGSGHGPALLPGTRLVAGPAAGGSP